MPWRWCIDFAFLGIDTIDIDIDTIDIDTIDIDIDIDDYEGQSKGSLFTIHYSLLGIFYY